MKRITKQHQHEKKQTPPVSWHFSNSYCTSSDFFGISAKRQRYIAFTGVKGSVYRIRERKNLQLEYNHFSPLKQFFSEGCCDFGKAVTVHGFQGESRHCKCGRTLGFVTLLPARGAFRPAIGTESVTDMPYLSN